MTEKNIDFMVFARGIKLAREEMNLTQQMLADELNTSQAQVSKYEMGISYPTSKRIQEIAYICGIDLCDLIELGEGKQD